MPQLKAIDRAAARVPESGCETAQFPGLASSGRELLAPLNRLLLVAQLLASDLEGRLTERQRDYALLIGEVGGELRRGLSDFLDLLELEAGTLAVDAESVPVPDLLREIRQVCGALAASKGLDFAVEIAADVPPAIVTDPLLLQQLLRRLLGNAIKFTREGGVILRIRQAAASASGMGPVAFEVVDTGIGIAPQRRRGMVEFFRSPPGGRGAFAGAGRGLGIVRQLAAALGARLELAGTPGGGSTFGVHLPSPATAARSPGLPAAASRSSSRPAA